MAWVALPFIAKWVMSYDGLELLCSSDQEIRTKIEPFPGLSFQQVFEVSIRFHETLENQIPALQ
jgi:hypothetical protein